jgi:hypothetical protein
VHQLELLDDSLEPGLKDVFLAPQVSQHCGRRGAPRDRVSGLGSAVLGSDLGFRVKSEGIRV